ncbi:MAG: FAD-binding oxidoreductase [Planctomycetota bacterium]
MTVSLWNRSPAPPPLDADLAIIGGGVCGLSAALHARRRGLSVVVLERHAAGSGASTRNAGYLMRGMADNYAAACDVLGDALAQQAWRWTEENLRGLQAEGVASLPSYRATPSCLLALDDDEAAQLQRSAELLQRDGFGALLVESGPDSAWASGVPLLGLVNPGDATVDPAELIAMLAAGLGGSVLPGQEVHEIVPASRGAAGRCIVRTGTLEVRAPRVLACTNAYARLLLPPLAGLVDPRRGQMLALACEGARLDYAYYANHGHEYIRQLPSGVIIAGGCRGQFAAEEVGYEDATSPRVQEAIAAFARLLLDRPIRVLARWAGTMGFSPDGMPLVGPVSEDGSVWFCGGFTGHGMSLGYRTAAGAIAGMLDGESADPLATAFALHRCLAPGEALPAAGG